MYKFPKIGQFNQAISEVKMRANYIGKDPLGNPIYKKSDTYPILTYRGTVKLHGTNSSIVSSPDETFCLQSRNRIISLEKDNAGFANFIYNVLGEDFTKNLLKEVRKNYCVEPEDTVILYGEWCGKGIQNGVAIAELDKMFVIFAVRVISIEDEKTWYTSKFISYPENRIFNITEFPYTDVEIDFSNPKMVQNQLVARTNDVENECPVAAKFGVSGIGEGIVWKCITPGFEGSRFWFKTKGKKHSVSRVKTIAPVDIEKLNSINEFVNYSLTEQRLLQGIDFLKEMDKELSTKSTGDFIRWIINDIAEEESESLNNSGLIPKDVNKSLSSRARNWFFKWLESQI